MTKRRGAAISAPRESPTRGLLARGPSTVPGAARFGPLSDVLRRSVEDAIRQAWSRLLRSPHCARVLVGGEVDVTVQLELELNAMLDDPDAMVPGWNGDVFQNVVRGGEVSNVDGTFLEKRPDLTIRLCGRVHEPGNRTHRGLWVECKILDAQHPITKYCDEGLERFLSGTYAAAMPEGLMLGYVRGGHTVPTLLTPHLSANRRKYLVQRLPRLRSGEPAGAWPLFVSTHSRRFTREGERRPPPIAVGHLWLPLAG